MSDCLLCIFSPKKNCLLCMDILFVSMNYKFLVDIILFDILLGNLMWTFFPIEI